jgi:hypothetical protein
VEFNNYNNAYLALFDMTCSYLRLTLPVFRCQWLNVDRMRNGWIEMDEQSDLQGVSTPRGWRTARDTSLPSAPR